MWPPPSLSPSLTVHNSLNYTSAHSVSVSMPPPTICRAPAQSHSVSTKCQLVSSTCINSVLSWLSLPSLPLRACFFIALDCATWECDPTTSLQRGSALALHNTGIPALAMQTRSLGLVLVPPHPRDAFEIMKLCNFSFWYVSSFYSSQSKHIMPF